MAKNCLILTVFYQKFNCKNASAADQSSYHLILAKLPKKLDEVFSLTSKELKFLMLIPGTALTVKRALSSLRFVKNDLSSPVTP